MWRISTSAKAELEPALRLREAIVIAIAVLAIGAAMMRPWEIEPEREGAGLAGQQAPPLEPDPLAGLRILVERNPLDHVARSQLAEALEQRGEHALARAHWQIIAHTPGTSGGDELEERARERLR